MDLNAFYENLASKRTKSSHEQLKRYEKSVSLCEIPDKSSILDLGCGNGDLKDTLDLFGNQLYYCGVDLIMPDEIYKNRVEMKQCNLNNYIPYPEKCFDLVFALEIIEHLYCPVEFLKEIKRVMKPSGTLVLSTPNPYSFWEILENLRGTKNSSGHLHSLTPQNVDFLVDVVGMKIIKKIGTTFRLPLIRNFRDSDYRYSVNSNNLFFSRSFIYKIGI